MSALLTDYIKPFLSHTVISQNVALLEEEEDVNQLTEYFSYEHFYVIYCKFWELDTDHDLYIDQRDMARHNDQGSSPVRLKKKYWCFITAFMLLYEVKCLFHPSPHHRGLCE